MNKNSLMVFLVVVASIVGYLAFNSVNKEIKYNNEVAMVNEMVIDSSSLKRSGDQVSATPR